MKMVCLAWLLALVMIVVVVWFARVYTQIQAIRRGDLDEEDGSVIGAAKWWVARDEP